MVLIKFPHGLLILKLLFIESNNFLVWTTTTLISGLQYLSMS